MFLVTRQYNPLFFYFYLLSSMSFIITSFGLLTMHTKDALDRHRNPVYNHVIPPHVEDNKKFFHDNGTHVEDSKEFYYENETNGVMAGNEGTKFMEEQININEERLDEKSVADNKERRVVFADEIQRQLVKENDRRI